MKTKRLKIEYFLLMGIAFLFHSVIKNDFIFTNKKISSYFTNQENKSKILYGFILEFQQKVEGFGVKKEKTSNSSLTLTPFSSGFIFTKDSYGYFTIKKEKISLKFLYDTAIFIDSIGLGERKYMSSYLV